MRLEDGLHSNGLKTVTWNLTSTNVIFYFLDTSMKMFGLNGERKNLGQSKTKVAWDGNRNKSEFWWLK